MTTLRKKDELDLDLALRALRYIRTYCGVICEECGTSGLVHAECISSQKAWNIATQALEKISMVQQGTYHEFQLQKYRGKDG